MLVLTRREGESIVLTLTTGQKIRVVVLDNRGTNLCRIGIEAPDEVTVHREELLAEMEADKEPQP